MKSKRISENILKRIEAKERKEKSSQTN